MNNTLYPPISQLKHHLFQPSDELLLKLVDKDSDIPIKVRKAALSQPEIQQAVTELSEAVPADFEVIACEPPLFIKDLINRRCATQNASFDPLPTEGQILRIDQVKDPKQQLDWQLGSPLAVLLDSPTEASADLWHGWLVSPDTDYADYWDVLLEPCDEPFDPLAGMVQIWNPVCLWIPQANQVIGQISLARVQAIRAVASEFLCTETINDTTNPGFISSRNTLHGYRVLTGTPLGDENDPRHTYQNLYHTVAKAIKEPARIALAQLAPSFLTHCKKMLTDLRDHLGQAPLLPSTLIPQAMSSTENSNRPENTYKLRDYPLHLCLKEYPDIPSMLQLSLNYSESNGELTIILEEDGIATETHTISAEQPTVSVEIESDKENRLIIKTHNSELSIPLHS